YASLSNDETRTAGTVRGSFDSTRWFGGTMVSGNYRGDNWLFNASFSYIYTEQKDDAYTESGGAGAGAVRGNTAKIAQGQLGLRIGYDIAGSGFVPFMTARLEHEFTHPGNAVVAGDAVVSDATGYILGGGLGYSRGVISAGIEGDTIKGRSSLTDYQVLGDIRFRF
ncbi:MAG TPA: autotransporter domain-containing protein, partial [Candidatus Sulfotelmatobacter sp.]|nr:autotransporter domain-containing protein [Candidatus Sulfotelmatobacter sp.]